MGVAVSAYRTALDFLFARTTGKTKVGLERTRALLEALGDPHLRVPAFHVAGTNGKGSVCATLEALLRRRGLRVGKYTSPHLVDFRERVVVDGEPIAEEAVVEWVERWTPECERLGATFFEATTALAFDYFAAVGCDVTVIETGLGGRLDSTNVLERPLCAGVTSIGIDHTDYLGDTIEAIAAEKAGIFKAGCPAAVGEGDARVRDLLVRLAEERGASSILAPPADGAVGAVRVGADGTHFMLRRNGRGAPLELFTPLAGTHQAGNAALAVAMLDAAGGEYAPSDAELAAGLRDVWLPGRFQRAGRWLFDVAHNPDGAGVLARTLAASAPARPVVAVLTVLSDKDWRGIMRALAPVVDRFVVTAAPTAPESRAWDAREALAYARGCGWPAALEEDFATALDRAASEGETVLVTGSFHTVGDAMALLQLSPFHR